VLAFVGVLFILSVIPVCPTTIETDVSGVLGGSFNGTLFFTEDEMGKLATRCTLA
jgi:hypothetical protein